MRSRPRKLPCGQCAGRAPAPPQTAPVRRSYDARTCNNWMNERMRVGAVESFGGQLKALRESAGFTQDELATIAGLSVHAVSALERGERRRPHVETVRALSAALDLNGPTRDALLASARAAAPGIADGQLRDVSLPLAPTVLLGRDADVQTLRRWLDDPIVRLVTLTGPGGAG